MKRKEKKQNKHVNTLHLTIYAGNADLIHSPFRCLVGKFHFKSDEIVIFFFFN